MKIRKKLIVTMLAVIAAVFAMTGCGGTQTDPDLEPEVTPEVTVEPTAEPIEEKERRAYLMFFNEDGDSNGEIYELVISDNIEDALKNKSEINVGVETYNYLMFSENRYKPKRIKHPFTYNTLVDYISYVGDRYVLEESLLNRIVGGYVDFIFTIDGDNTLYHSVVKIQ